MKNKLSYCIAICLLGILLFSCKSNNRNEPEMKLPEGSLSGEFSVSENTKVRFSKGNLQYNTNEKTYRFAENQWDVIGDNNLNILSEGFDGWMDLFGWGTGSNPDILSADWSDYQTFDDWGLHPISNGGNEFWHTLTSDEWIYLFHDRINATILFGFANINGVNGIVILPDNWVQPENTSFTASTLKGLMFYEDSKSPGYYSENANSYYDNSYGTESWATMESAGAVFLPCSGIRFVEEGEFVILASKFGGVYWTSDIDIEDEQYSWGFMYELLFDIAEFELKYNIDRNAGASVRLVQYVK